MTIRLLPALLTGLALFIQPANAQEYRVKDITVSHPWARATAGPARAGAAYLSISNHGQTMDRLVAAATPAARRAHVHTTLMDQGVMKMRPVKAVEVRPGEPTVFRPGGLHIMLMGLAAPLEEGARFPLTLTFEKAGTIEVQVVVKGLASMGHTPDAPKAHRHGS